jgi:hypothetical protein
LSFSNEMPPRMNMDGDRDSVRQQEQTRDLPANGDSINLGQVCR